MSVEVRATFDNVIRAAEQDLDAEQKLKAELSAAVPRPAEELAEQNQQD